MTDGDDNFQDSEQKRVKDALDRGIQREFIQRNFPLYQGMPLKAGAGSIMGYCLGTFAKLLSIILIWWIGCCILFLAFM